jgi:mono/diheme cytochrome c family protein
VRHLRWLVLLGVATVLCCVAGFGVIQGQAMAVPDADLPDGVKNAGEFAPPGWSPGQTHPGQQAYEQYCATCHALSSQTKTGPGFRGLFERVNETSYEGKAVQQRMLEYVRDVVNVQDPYFLEVQKTKGPTANRDMTERGGMPAGTTDREFLDVIDYILRFYAPDFDESEYMKKVRLGRDMVSGARSFANGAPSCIGCHTVGPDNELRGANIGGNVAHTFVVASAKPGAIDEDMYSEGLFQILSGDDAPQMHRYYRDGVGHLNDGELLAVMTFFEHQMRQVGTEEESNFLPIFALVLAALMVLLMEPGLYANLFVKEEHEYVDGPYEGEHHDDHPAEASGGPPPTVDSPPANPQGDGESTKPEDKAKDKAEDKSDQKDEKADEGKQGPG